MKNLVRKYDTRNPLDIAERIGCIIVKHKLDGIRRFYHYFQRSHIIYIDERLSENEMMFVIAHELGHALLHKSRTALFMDSRTFLLKSKCENEANLFALNLLISDSDIEEDLVFTTSQFP